MTENDALPPGYLVAFYGDDFTGSSAVMEVLTFAGLPTVLFLDPPSPQDLNRFRDYSAVGVAGVARSLSPSWMEGELPIVFSELERLGAPINHYKTCSTLDSSPTVGSIGRAIDLGVPVFAKRPGAADWQPVVIAAPEIGRFQAFGNLFATHEHNNYRLDRHPVMHRHPSTPMDESDVVRHLEKQTEKPIGLIDVATIKAGNGGAEMRKQKDAGKSLISLDVLDEETLVWAGREIWEGRGSGIFAIGSQGVEYALTAYWRQIGILAPKLTVLAAAPVDQIIVVSGSVSSTTASQIEWATLNGFDVVQLDPQKALSDDAWPEEIKRVVHEAKATLSAGRSPIIATALGPTDPSVQRIKALTEAGGAVAEQVHARIGGGLGTALKSLIGATGVRRVVIAGGDTSGHAAKSLEIRAFTALAPLAPGSPLCLAYSDAPQINGLEIALKGGQMGRLDFFGTVRAGRTDDNKEN